MGLDITWIEFRSGTEYGQAIALADVMGVIIGAIAGHDRVVITAMRGRPGGLAGEPISGCYATVYPSEDGEYPLVSLSPVEMPDAKTSDLQEDCAETASRLACRAWQLLMPSLAE